MDALLEKVEKVLAAEVDIHNEIIKSSLEFNAAIKSGETEAIDRQRNAHDAALCTLERLEEERVATCSDVASALGISRSPLKLSMLMERISTEWKVRLEKQQLLLRGKLAELTSITTSNRILLEEGLKFISATFDCVKKSGNRFSGYGKRGQTMSSSLMSIINRTA